jgi:hypothetical protein
MASTRAGLTAEGALYEAVARGNKDTFFFGDNPDNTLNPFENRYDPTPAMIHELRRIPPLNGAEFGRSCEFDFEIAGDVFVQPTVLIDLPSWLPPTETGLNPTTTITDLSGATYGYTNGIGYFMFNKIQIFQDKLLLMEFSGDALFASRAARGTLASAYMENKLAGWHDGSAQSIGAAATPPRIRLELPFVGGHRGFPSIAMRHQPFKLRLELRTLESIVESSTGLAAAPWLLPALKTPSYIFKPLVKNAMASPTLQLETRHMYVDGDTALSLRKEPLEIPFSRIYENTNTFGATDYAPLQRGVPAVVTRRVDGQHPASRILWFLRAQADIQAGRRWRFAQNGGEYYTAQSFVIAGRDRETLFTPFVWNTLTHHAKEERDPGTGIGEMSWDLGDVYGRAERQPEGSVNFTTADRPTLYTSLAATPTPSTEMTAIVDTWAFYTIEKDRGFLKYGN